MGKVQGKIIEGQKLPGRRRIPCLICGTLFTKNGRRIYCSPPCSKIAQTKQLKEAYARKLAARPVKRMQPCAICQTPFLPFNSRSIYCKTECRAAGLKRCVENQKLKRLTDMAAPEMFTQGGPRPVGVGEGI